MGGPERRDPADVRTAEMARLREIPSNLRVFGSGAFFRLWLAQAVSSFGDWIGLAAIIALAARVGGKSPETSISLVISARMIPGFFLASVGGVLVDRWDRRKVMVTCDIGRGLVIATLPFIADVWGLFVASLALEILTLLWSPAKEASVPNLVTKEQLTTANSLSLAAAYGTFPIGTGAFAALAGVAGFLGRHLHSLHFLRLNQESLAIYADVLTFFVSAALIASLTLPRQRGAPRGRTDLGQTLREVREGWRVIGTTPVVRSVMVGLGTGLIGGGMIVPLGPVFSGQVLHAGTATGFGLLLTAMGMGVAAGVLAVSAVQRRVPRAVIFPWAVLGAGACLAAAASMSQLAPTMALIAGMGVCTGAVYVLGFTLLQENVEDDLRGRVFATLYTLVRFCLLVSLSLGGLLARLLNSLSQRWFGGRAQVGHVTVGLPGVRLALWAGGAIIMVAGGLALWSLRWLQPGSRPASPANSSPAPAPPGAAPTSPGDPPRADGATEASSVPGIPAVGGTTLAITDLR